MTLFPRVIVLVLLAILPAAMIEGYAEWSKRQAEEAALLDEAADTLSDIQAAQERRAFELHRILTTVAATRAVLSGDAADCGDLLHRLAQRYPPNVTVRVTGTDGIVRCATDRAAEGLDVSRQGHFRMAMDSGYFAGGTYVRRPPDGAPALAFAMPAIDAEGQIRAVVTGFLGIEWLTDYLNRNPPSRYTTVTLADPEGNILAQHPAAEATGVPASYRRPLETVAAGQARLEIGGRAELVAFAPLEGTPGLELFVAIDEAAAARGGGRLLVSMAEFGAILLATVVVGLVGRRQLVRKPVNRILEAMARWQAGDTSARVETRGGGSEIEQLAVAFNAMAEEVDKRDRAREEAREEALRMERDALAARDEANSARLQAERAALAKAKFLAAASHDLRQPMQSLFLFADLLGRHVEHPQGREALRHMHASLSALKGLLDSLLDISRLDAGVIVPQVRVFPLGEVTEELAAGYTLMAQRKGLYFHIPAPAEHVTSDPTLLSRILRNLVENAFRYTREGGVEIACVAADPGHLRIEVRDTGIGIPPESQEDIFAEFHQLGNPERDREHGLGLGLAIVKRLARLLGHELTVSSAPGQGSTFAVTVPLAKPLAAPAPGPAEAPPATGGDLLVVIEDDALVRTAIAGVLERWRYRIVAAAGADEALRALNEKDEAPALVFADYRLRGDETGTAAVAALRRRFGAGMPAVILTGETDPDILQAVNGSRLEVVHKPVTPDMLARLISRLVPAGETVHSASI